MAMARIITLDTTFSNPEGLPKSINYGRYFPTIPSLRGWFDMSQSDLISIEGGGVSAVSARAGTLGLVQTEPGNRPTYGADAGRLLFDRTSSQFMAGVGDHPATAVTLAVILRRSAVATTTEGVLGGNQPASGQHTLFYQATGGLRYRLQSPDATTYEDPADPIPPLDQNMLILASYDQSSSRARCRVNGGAGGNNSIGAQPISMNPAWFLGALTAAGASPCSMEVADLFVFDAVLDASVQDVLLSYARDVKGVV